MVRIFVNYATFFKNHASPFSQVCVAILTTNLVPFKREIKGLIILPQTEWQNNTFDFFKLRLRPLGQD